MAEILGHNMSKDPAVWDEIIKQVDLNGDGLIDFKEFKEMMSKFTSWSWEKTQILLFRLYTRILNHYKLNKMHGSNLFMILNLCLKT